MPDNQSIPGQAQQPSAPPLANVGDRASVISRLTSIAKECRVDIIKMLQRAGSGHPGGSLSVIDLLVTLFYTEIQMDPKNPYWEERDRCVLSKGHAVPALYTILSKKGAFPREELWTLRQINSRLQGHPDRILLPFVEASTGSLGQGLSIAQGIALGLKLAHNKRRVFCVMGDGEIQEGQIWEAALSAPKFKLNNLVAIVDNNNGQIDGHVEEVMDLRPLADKWRSFRWAVHEIDGHNFGQILDALALAKKEQERPTLIVAHTVKGKGVSFMENVIGWHGTAPSKEEAEKAINEIEGGVKS
jgi:transketolase